MDPVVRQTLLAYNGSENHRAVIFGSLRDLVHAVARKKDDEPVLRAAARFICDVMLAADADAHTVLGLLPGASAADVKTHYRLLMRILHPDFARKQDVLRWPEGAAARLNNAYEELSKPKPPARPDASTSPPSPSRRRSVVPKVDRAPRARRAPRTTLKILGGLFGVAGLSSLALLFWIGGRENAVQLVQLDLRTPVPEFAGPHRDAVAAESAAWPGTLQLSHVVDVAPAAPAPANAHASDALPAHLSEARVSQARDEAAIPPMPAPPEAARPNSREQSEPPKGAAVAPVATLVTDSSPGAPADSPATMGDAQVQILRILEILESGQPEKMLGLLDSTAQREPGADAFVRQYAGIVRIGQPAKILSVQLRSTTHDRRLFVNGRISLQFRGDQDSVVERAIPLEAVFERRHDAVVLTRVSMGG